MPGMVASMQSHYENTGRTLFYLYALPTLFTGIGVLLFNANINRQKRKKALLKIQKLLTFTALERMKITQRLITFLKFPA
jgi:hypothetical protein